MIKRGNVSKREKATDKWKLKDKKFKNEGK
jgi:hypothetical protein